MTVHIRGNGALRGTVTLPASKSITHRALIAAALADGTSTVRPLERSDDIRATMDGLRAMGATVCVNDGVAVVEPIRRANASAEIDCGESGSTLRFLLPLAAMFGMEATFFGSGRLPKRPIDGALAWLRDGGCRCTMRESAYLPLTVSGRWQGTDSTVDVAQTSQVASGVLMALAARQGGFVTVRGGARAYVDLTADVLRRFGCDIQNDGAMYRVNSRCHATDFVVGGDWSHAMIFLAAATLGGDVVLRGLSMGDAQNERGALALFEEMGCRIAIDGGNVHACGGDIRAICADVSEVPDSVPALAVTAAFADGESRFFGVGRLRNKESDRLAVLVEGLSAMGAEAFIDADALVVRGGKLHGAVLSCGNDHRMAMAFAVAAQYARGESQLKGAQTVSKSYPEFWNDFLALGGEADVKNR